MRFSFVGDIALGDHPKAVGFGFRSRYKDGIIDRGGRLRPPGAAPDLFFANLEFPLGFKSGSARLEELECWGHLDYVDYLASEGVNAVNVATNHAAQHGPLAFDSTVQRLRAAGIHVVGTPADFTDQGVLILGGRRVALLGWSDRPRQHSPLSPPYNEFSEDAYATVAAAKTRADLVIVSMHWGDEFVLVPGEREREIGRRMVDAGASLVIGHHPHVVRELEQYGGATIAYSLGNFVCDMTWDERTRLSCWLSVEVDSAGRLASALLPARIADDYFPELLRNADLPTWEAIEREREQQRDRLRGLPYAQLAAVERRRHAFRTARQMLVNWNRYPKGTATQLFSAALGNRVSSFAQRLLSVWNGGRRRG